MASTVDNAMEGGMRDPIFNNFSTILDRKCNEGDSGNSSSDVKTEPKVEVMDFLTKRNPAAEKKGWIIRNSLSASECSSLIAASEASGYQPAEEFCFMYARRNNDRMMCDDKDLAAYLWERVAPCIPEVLTFDGRHSWRAYKLNARFRICRYYSGGHFGIHSDGTFAYDEDHRSFLTCMFYLNEGNGVDFKGGTTDFIENTIDRGVQYRLVPSTGLCVVFKQMDSDCLHCGTELTSGTKYILRTDVMFERVKSDV
eukprot:scpid81886/ scgid14001/ 